MYTKEGNKLLKEVEKLAQGTIFRVEDMEGQYDMFDRIEITTQVVSFVAMTAAKEKVKRQKTIKFIENIQKIANKYGYDVVDCMNYGYSEDDMWDFIESFSVSHPTKIDEFIGVFVIERMLSEEEMDNLDESNNFNAFAPGQTSLMESFNGFANLNQMAVFRPNALKNNIHGFDECFMTAIPNIKILPNNQDKLLAGIAFISDKKDENKDHFVLYIIDDFNTTVNPFDDLDGLEGTKLTKELRRIWEFEPSYVLYGGYIINDLEVTPEDYWDKILDKLVDYICPELYRKTKGFIKGHLIINASKLLKR